MERISPLNNLPLKSFKRSEKKELFRMACMLDRGTGKDYHADLMHKILMAADQASEMMRALNRISNSEPLPNKQGKVDVADVHDLQRIARTAIVKIKK